VIPSRTAITRPTLSETLLLPTLTPTNDKTWTPTPTRFVDTYPYKQIWLIYSYFSGGHYVYESQLGPDNFPTLVLYTDGQLIVNHDQKAVQNKVLSPDEICNLFITLENMGISQIKTTGKGDLDDPIYENTTGLENVFDAGGTTLYINGIVPRLYFVYDPYKERAVKRIMDIFAFLNQYSPSNLQPYQADRLAIYVQEGRDEYLWLHPDAGQLKAVSWPSQALPLSRIDNGESFLEGEAASVVFGLTGRKTLGAGVFVDQGIEYSVYDRVFFPHDPRDRYSDTHEQATPFKPAFSCKIDVFN
jgi:hypothetical protein